MIHLDVPYLRWRYYRGPKGLGGWTTKADKDGWYHAFYLKPSGPGSRDGKAITFKYVSRTDTKRRKRKDAENRAFQLAMGAKRVVQEKPAPVVNPAGTGYCMGCKEKVKMIDVTNSETEKGRQVIRGRCPDCGTTIQKFGKVADCPECGEVKEMSATDYICKECRLDNKE